MNETPGKEDLKAEIDRGHFARAALLASSLGLPEDQIRDLRRRALWQMAAVFRNAAGTKILAQQYGLSKNDLQKILEKYAEEKKNDRNDKALEPCYEQATGKYLSFEEWMDHLLKNFDKL